MYAILYVAVMVIVARYSKALTREICLQRALEFPGRTNQCFFHGSFALEHFNKDPYKDTCQTKCSVTIQNLWRNYWYTLENIHLTVVDKTFSTICSSRNEDGNIRNLYINCSPRKFGNVVVGGTCTDNKQCQGIPDSFMCRNFGNSFIAIQQNCFDDAVALNKPCHFNEQCSHAPHALCLQGKCGCTEGYSVYDSAAGCLKDNVEIGKPCRVDGQCRGYDVSTVCENLICTCTIGYISLGEHCYEGVVALNEPCQFNEQCSHAPHALCIQGKCGCTEGYSVYYSAAGCLKDNVNVGKSCVVNEQCKGTPMSTVCENSTCTCTKGYISLGQLCYEEAIALNMPCMFHEQCFDFPHALCLNGNCGCIEGYSAHNSSKCLQDNVDVGESCVINEQCRGKGNSAVCENSTCTCTEGYISLGERCYEGNVGLGDSCVVNAQCSGSPNTSCFNGTCNCNAEYVPDILSRCIQSIQDNVKEALFGDPQESNVGGIMGALLGGVLLGVLITIIGFIIYRRLRKSPSKPQREEPQVVFADNNAYGEVTKKERNADNNSRGNKKKRKVVNVPPYAPCDETPEYGNILQTSVARTEEIYNHLNEKEERDDEDNYDHACAVTGLTRGGYVDSDYSSMRDVDKGCGKSAKNGADNYFTLEQN